MPLYSDFDINDPSPSSGVTTSGSLTARMMGRMHKVLRESPAIRLRGLYSSVARGLLGVNVGAFSQALYLSTALGKWLDIWGLIYVVPRKPNETDSTYRARLIDEVSNPKGATPVQLAADILAATGLTAVFRHGQLYDANLEDWQAIYNNNRTQDLTEVALGTVNSKQIFPWAGAYQPGGYLLFMGVPRNAGQEVQIRNVLAKNGVAGGWFDIIWSDLLPGNRDRYGERTWREIIPRAVSTPVGGGLLYLPTIPVFAQR